MLKNMVDKVIGSSAISLMPKRHRRHGQHYLLKPEFSGRRVKERHDKTCKEEGYNCYQLDDLEKDLGVLKMLKKEN